MASLNLPGALDDTKGDEVPSSLLSKAAVIRNAGGAAVIEELFNGMPDVISRNKDILNEVDFGFPCVGLLMVLLLVDQYAR